MAPRKDRSILMGPCPSEEPPHDGSYWGSPNGLQEEPSHDMTPSHRSNVSIRTQDEPLHGSHGPIWAPPRTVARFLTLRAPGKKRRTVQMDPDGAQEEPSHMFLFANTGPRKNRRTVLMGPYGSQEEPSHSSYGPMVPYRQGNSAVCVA